MPFIIAVRKFEDVKCKDFYLFRHMCVFTQMLHQYNDITFSKHGKGVERSVKTK